MWPDGKVGVDAELFYTCPINQPDAHVHVTDAVERELVQEQLLSGFNLCIDVS